MKTLYVIYNVLTGVEVGAFYDRTKADGFLMGVTFALPSVKHEIRLEDVVQTEEQFEDTE